MELKFLRKARSEVIGGLVVAIALAVIRELHFNRATWTVIYIKIGWILGGCAYVASKRTPAVIEEAKAVWKYPHSRPWALAVLITIPLLTAGEISCHFCQQAQPPTKVILSIANFSGPDQQKNIPLLLALTKAVALIEYTIFITFCVCVIFANMIVDARAAAKSISIKMLHAAKIG